MYFLVVSVSLQDIHTKQAFRSSQTFDQQVVSRNTMPKAMLEMYMACDQPPPLHKLNPYRDDGKDGLKFYTDPTYFFELWRQEMLKDTERMMHDKSRKDPSGQKGERRDKKRIKNPQNTAEKMKQKAVGQGEYIMENGSGIVNNGGIIGYDPALAPEGYKPHLQQQPQRLPNNGAAYQYNAGNEDIYMPRILRSEQPPQQQQQQQQQPTSQPYQYHNQQPVGMYHEQPHQMMDAFAINQQLAQQQQQQQQFDLLGSPTRRPNQPPPAPPPGTNVAGNRDSVLPSPPPPPPAEMQHTSTPNVNGHNVSFASPTSNASQQQQQQRHQSPMHHNLINQINSHFNNQSSSVASPSDALPPPPPIPATTGATPTTTSANNFLGAARVPVEHLPPSPPPPPPVDQPSVQPTANGIPTMTAAPPVAAPAAPPAPAGAPPPPPPPPPPPTASAPLKITNGVNNGDKKASSPVKTNGAPSTGLKKPAQPFHMTAQDGMRSDLLKAIRDGKIGFSFK